MIELPGFLRNYKRDSQPLPSRSRAVCEVTDELYSEFWANDGDAAWAASPRGKWVTFQLQWIESRGQWRSW